jgi:uncharacterized membrane protein (UPF0127 family)
MSRHPWRLVAVNFARGGAATVRPVIRRPPRPAPPRRRRRTTGCVRGAALVGALVVGACAGPGAEVPPSSPEPSPSSAVTSGSSAQEPAPTPSPTVVASPTPAVVDHGARVPPLHPSVDGYDETRLELVANDGTVHRLPVKVARTRAEQLHGLMEVETLPDGTGMWFVFDEPRTGGFWMYETLVPLSIAYIDGDGRIVDLLDMEPCPPEDGRDCPDYPPDAAYLTTLEVPQGWFDRVGIVEGDLVRPAG